MRAVAIFWLLAAAAFAAGDPLTQAFQSLEGHDYDDAIAFFRQAETAEPARADIHLNLAYTLLKAGDTAAARDEFGMAMRLNPADAHAALEYAFLLNETQNDNPDSPAAKAEARRIFARVRDDGSAASDLRAEAGTAFANIDVPLAAGIARWQLALGQSAPTFSARYELARIAEECDEKKLAAEQYRAAFLMMPDRRYVLIDLARVDPDGAVPALLAASRGDEPRAAELARARMPERYPYVYEFRLALDLDPGNVRLRRELAYLLLQMSAGNQASRDDAEREFEKAADRDLASAAQLGLLWHEDHRDEQAMPLLNRVLREGDEATANQVRRALNMPPVFASRPAVDSLDRALGLRSYEAGYWKDAVLYLTRAHEADPHDDLVTLRLAWTQNQLRDDHAAFALFDQARHGVDPSITAEAQQAWKNLRPEEERFRLSGWFFPLLSSRWNDAFGYAQMKAEWRPRFVLHPYASLRYLGDIRQTTVLQTNAGPLPASLSENAFIAGVGASTDPWHRIVAWGEAGMAFSYQGGAHWADYRGGVSFARTFGSSLTAPRNGWFLESLGDSVYVSHFDHDLINYLQLRAGHTNTVFGIHIQEFWAQNITADVKRQYWANFAEGGPGIRVHPPGTPLSLWINVSAVHGVCLHNEGNPGRPNFNDIRIGIWYAFSH